MSKDSEKEILKSLKNNKLICLFQPIVTAQNLDIIGYEALVTKDGGSTYD